MDRDLKLIVFTDDKMCFRLDDEHGNTLRFSPEEAINLKLCIDKGLALLHPINMFRFSLKTGERV